MRIVSHVNNIFNSITYVILDDKNMECWIVDVGDYEDIKKIIN